MSNLPAWCCPYCGKPVGYLGRALAKVFGTSFHGCDGSLVKRKGTTISLTVNSMTIWDFSAMPAEAENADSLRRTDLATLRQIYAAGDKGVEPGDLISKAAKRRLVLYDLVTPMQNNRLQTVYVITRRGRLTVDYNTSTIDGSEGYERKRA